MCILICSLSFYAENKIVPNDQLSFWSLHIEEDDTNYYAQNKQYLIVRHR